LVFTHEFIATFKKLPKENIDKMPIQHEEDGKYYEYFSAIR
jgi:hypothetical protein